VNRGRSAACNSAIHAARGEFVTFLADDDLYYPHHVATNLAALDRLGPGHAVYSHAIQVTESEDGTALDRKVTGARDFNGDLLKVTNFICAACVMVPTALLQELDGFDTSLDVLEDWELWLRVADRIQWHHVSVPTAEYRMRDGHGNSTTREFFRFHPALERVYEKHPLPVGSPLQPLRDQMLAGSESRLEAYGFEFSVAIACSADPGAVMPSLLNVVEVLQGESYEVVLLVPQVDGWGGLLSSLGGDVQTYAVGDVSSEEAWGRAMNRAAGRHVLLIEGGEHLDPGLVGAARSAPRGSAVRAGRRPAPVA
jgi:glycosyl transferase family 2